MNLHRLLNQQSFSQGEAMMRSAHSYWGNNHTTSPKTSAQPLKIVSSGLSVTSCAILAPYQQQLPTLTSTKLPACDSVPCPSPAEVNVNLWPGQNLCKPESSTSFDSLFSCSASAKTSMMSLFTPGWGLAGCKVAGRSSVGEFVGTRWSRALRWKGGPGHGLCEEVVYEVVYRCEASAEAAPRGVKNSEPAVFLLLMDSDSPRTSLFSVPAVSAIISPTLPWNINKVELLR